MKTVSGKIVSTKPVNLSKAANILSNFVTSDNGASQSVLAYLRRSSVAFDELVYFKKHHKLKKPRPKDESLTKSNINSRSSDEDEISVHHNVGVDSKIDKDPVEIDKRMTGKVERKLRKKEKKKKATEESLGSGQGDEIEDKKKKKRKNADGNSVSPGKKKRRVEEH